MEVELQYLLDPDASELVPVELAGFALADSMTFEILDTYYDTVDLALRRAGCSLRIRRAHNLPRPLLVWKGPASRRADGAKEREESEIPLESVPDAPDGLMDLLVRFRLWKAIVRSSGIDDDTELHAIGELRNRRSSHVYVQGLHRIELTWDRLAYPVGPPETRIEVEARSESAGRFLERVDGELRALFGDHIVPAPQGKSRELCERLYPDLISAS